MKTLGVSQINFSKPNFKGHLYVDQSCKYKDHPVIKKFNQEIQSDTYNGLNVLITDMPKGEGKKVRVDDWEKITARRKDDELWQDVPGDYSVYGRPPIPPLDVEENLQIKYQFNGKENVSGFYFDKHDEDHNIAKYLWENLKAMMSSSIR